MPRDRVGKSVAFGQVLAMQDASSMLRQREKEQMKQRVLQEKRRSMAERGFAGKRWKADEAGTWANTTFSILGNMERLVMGSPGEAAATVVLRHVHHIYTAQDDSSHFDDRILSSLEKIGANPELVVLLRHSQGPGTPKAELVIVLDKAEHMEALGEAIKVNCIDALATCQTGLLGSCSRLTFDGMQRAQFLQTYKLSDEKLGEGARGVVLTCTRRDTRELFAVKMVDKVEMKLEDINREIDFLARLSHPNIVKSVDLLFERCFVCIVMERFVGTDLVKALQLHTQEKKKVQCHHFAPLAKQMLAGVAYLHHESIIHRDINGENFLLSTKDLQSPDCRVALTDFGLARELEPGERLTEQVGMKSFWSPEQFGQDYGFKADVWALGVIIYGCVMGRFPFRDSHGIRFKEAKVAARISPDCTELIGRLLEKEEKKRPSAADLVDHPWFTSIPAGRAMDRSEDVSGPEAPCEEEPFRKAFVHDGIRERRRELLNRLESKETVKPARTSFLRGYSTKIREKKFSVEGEGLSISYAWWKKADVKKAKLLSALEARARPFAKTADKAGDLDAFKAFLEEHSVDVTLFGKEKAKTLQDLLKEVHTGDCQLMQDAEEHKRLVRVVDFVLLNLSVSAGGETRTLVQTGETSKDGCASSRKRALGSQKEAFENTLQTVGRLLQGVGLQLGQVDLTEAASMRYEEELTSSSYPGLRTVSRTEAVQGRILGEALASLSSIGLPGFANFSLATEGGTKKHFAWLTEDQMEEAGLNLMPDSEEFVSSLVRPPVGLNEEDLALKLEKLGIDVTKYGSAGEAISLRDFSAELMRGESTLGRDPKGQAMRVVTSAILILENKQSGEFLLQVQSDSRGGSKAAGARFPSVECWPNEDHFLTMKRLLQRSLDVDDNDVKFHREVELIEEENPVASERQRELRRYPGLKTLYRRRIIRAELV